MPRRKITDARPQIHHSTDRESRIPRVSLRLCVSVAKDEAASSEERGDAGAESEEAAETARSARGALAHAEEFGGDAHGAA